MGWCGKAALFASVMAGCRSGARSVAGAEQHTQVHHRMGLEISFIISANGPAPVTALP